jgi:homoserine dehydrogenase
MNGNAIRIALLGCGTVGTGVLRLVRDHEAEIRARLGAGITMTRVLVRDLKAPRDEAVPPALLTTDFDEVLASKPDLIVEVMGGCEPARTLTLRALAAGHHVVTANKALLARHGAEIFAAAERASRDVIFEASVGGGIPVIRTIREGLAADRVRSVSAIINGTSNFILTAMSERGETYEAALAQAQALGYAEADPSMDVDGLDAAQKLSILIAISFGVDAPFDAIRTEGIGQLTPADFAVARQMGYAVKPLAIARAHADGIEARVAPTLIPERALLAHVHGVFNAVMVEGDALGPVLFQGQGAGMMPTAAAVVSDIIELGRNLSRGTSGRIPHLAFHRDLVPDRAGLRDAGLTECPFYLRFTVLDVPGVIASVTTILGAQNISIRRMVQEDSLPGASVTVVVLTHTANEGAVRRALAAIDALPFVTRPTALLRVEEPA